MRVLSTDSHSHYPANLLFDEASTFKLVERPIQCVELTSAYEYMRNTRPFDDDSRLQHSVNEQLAVYVFPFLEAFTSWCWMQTDPRLSKIAFWLSA